MSTPLQGIKVLDFTGVQSGPSCTQMLAWFGADVIKIERPGVGDVTRHQLRDIPDIDALYFTMLNSNKRSIELNTKTAEGKEVMEKLIREADILVENFHPGAIDHMGFTWEHIQEINPRLIFGSIKGFDECSPYVNVKAYENVAQAAGGAASTTGFWDGPPLVSAAALGDSNTGMHLLIGLLAALLHREKTGRGQRVTMSMQDAVLNLCRVKLRDQQRLDKLGYLEEYPQYPNGTFGDAVPRGGNAGGGGQPGWIFCRNSCSGSAKVSNTIKLPRITLLIALNVGLARGFARAIFPWCNISVRKKLKLRLFVRKKSAPQKPKRVSKRARLVWSAKKRLALNDIRAQPFNLQPKIKMRLLPLWRG